MFSTRVYSEFLATQRRAYPNIRANPNIEHKWLVEKFPEWLLAQVRIFHVKLIIFLSCVVKKLI